MQSLSSLANRRILLGISGGIAAYKAAELVRRIREQGADVRVVMTRGACEFITPLTMQAVSGHPVSLQLLDESAESGMGHIELARWADRILIAPATADFMARLAQGRTDDLLAAICLASSAPVSVAPAMNQGMWQKPTTAANADALKSVGVALWGPAVGVQACGDTGPGRMLDVPDLLQKLAASFDTGVLAGLRVMVSAGPTREPLDPVRYLSNHSSGKMGYALAQAAIDAGARTTLVSGPVALEPPPRLAELVQVGSACEMYEAVMQRASDVDIFISAAAVADYRPSQVAPQKIKKGTETSMLLELVKNPDIVANVAAVEPRPFVVGFAAETTSVGQYAREKLARKQLDAIVANNVSEQGLGFNSDMNAVEVIWPEGERAFPPMQKTLLAEKIMNLLSELYVHASVTQGGML